MRGLKNRTTAGVAASVLSMAVWVSFAGCGKDEDAVKYRELEGRVSSVDLNNGSVKMWYYSPKHQQERLIVGRLAPDAEILINGKTARLEDVRVEDRVRVTGREEKRDGKRDVIATKVEITRPEPVTTEPAPSQPAATGAGNQTEKP